MSQANIYRKKHADIAQNARVALDDPDFCQIKSKCQSCAYINEAYQQKLQKKLKDAVEPYKSQLGDLGQDVKVTASPRTFHYRTHVKLAVRPAPKSSDPVASRFAIGLFAPGSHQVVDLSACPVQHEPINDFLQDLRGLLDASELQPYNEQTLTGDLRYIAIRSSHVVDAMMITFVVNQGMERSLKRLATAIRRTRHKVASIYMNVQSGSSNVIFGKDMIHIAGASKLRESVCELSFEISPTAFFQVNPWTAELAYRRIGQLAGSPKERLVAWDLFAGMGQIGMLLAHQGYRILSIEENAAAVVDAQQNYKLNNLESFITPLAGRTEDVQYSIPKNFANPQVIVANPSRKGIPATTIDFISNAMTASDNSKLIYLSCDLTTLMRDCSILAEHGIRLRQMEAFDMFPFTDKLEWLAVFTR